MAAANVPMATTNVPMATGGLLPPPTQSQHETGLSMSGGPPKLDDLLTASTSNSYTLAMNPVSLVHVHVLFKKNFFNYFFYFVGSISWFLCICCSDSASLHNPAHNRCHGY